MSFYFHKFKRLILKSFILILLFMFPISNSFGAMVTHKQSVTVAQSIDAQISGIEFNEDGTKMFTSYNKRLNEANGGNDTRFIEEFNLSKPFDISTRVSAGDSERCKLTGVKDPANFANHYIFDLTFSSDGMKFFVVSGRDNDNSNDGDVVTGFNLTSPYDVSTCVFASKTTNLDFSKIAKGSQAGTYTGPRQLHRAQGVEINNDGTKLFLLFSDVNDGTFPDVGARLYEFTLPTPYDVSTIWDGTASTIVTTAGIELPDTVLGANDPGGMRFTPNGKRILIIGHSSTNVLQISLTNAFDTSSFTIDGGINLNTGISPSNAHPRGVTFSTSGLKLYIGNDNDAGTDQVMEYDLVCPFNIISGDCPPITEDEVRTGIAQAQIMVANKNIDHSIKLPLNRLAWIKRNKDIKNLSNLNIDLNFNTATQLDNPLLNYWVKKVSNRIGSVNKKVEGGQPITIGRKDINDIELNNFTTAFKSDNPLLISWFDKLPEKITARKVSDTKKTEDKEKDVFFWSEGSIAVGRVGDTKISSFKKVGTEAITFGADKFTNNNGIKGLAFRLGNNNVDVGAGGSNIDTDTFNLSYYSTSPLESDTKSRDMVFGAGKLKIDMLTVLDGTQIKGSRDGRQVYGTIKAKDEIKKDDFILTSSFQVDSGLTQLDGYTESGTGAIQVEDQNINTLKLRTAIEKTDDLMKDSTFCSVITNETCFIKRHGKIEYMADLIRSSNFKYTYVSDNTLNFDEKLYSGALHNVNGEVGIDIILPDNFSIFIIYERNQALEVGHTDNINISIGYLPNKKTNYAFNLEGSENIGSEYKISKNINDFEIDFKLKNQNALKPNTVDEAFINLIRKF
jgi:hypothetical protein